MVSTIPGGDFLTGTLNVIAQSLLLPVMIKKIVKSNSKEDIYQIINSTKLNKYDKEILTEIASFDQTVYNKNAREILARNLLETHESKLVNSLRKVDIVAKVGSGCGLLGTIIPMGPGLAALGAGDMITLTTNLTTAFNTTTAGLAAGTICFVIAKIRRDWYNQDMNMLYDFAEAIIGVDYVVTEA